MSDTPRTDACLSSDFSDLKCIGLLKSESRNIESELTAANARIAQLEQDLESAKKDAQSWQQQADMRATEAAEYFGQLEKWKEYAERLVAAGNFLFKYCKYMTPCHKWHLAKESKP